MKTRDEYRRHPYRLSEPTPPAQVMAAATSELAAGSRHLTRPAKSLVWVRPTELTTYLAPALGRGIDLQAELTRRARSGPTTATRVLQGRMPRSASNPPKRSRPEGPSL